MRLSLPRALLLSLAVCLVANPAYGQAPRRPNIILIIADDMCHGDLGFHGTPILETPNASRLDLQRVRLRYFYGSSVCSPTRASLMTGRYDYRRGVIATSLARSMMRPHEATLTAVLAGAGYRTSMFGKWL